MLLQAYDFWHLHRTLGVELQMGGADQWGNITAGLELIRRTTGVGEDAAEQPAHGLAYKLLLSPSGTKFGKSEERRRGLARPGAHDALRVLPVLAEHRRPRCRDVPALVHRADRGTRSRRSRRTSRRIPRRAPRSGRWLATSRRRTHGETAAVRRSATRRRCSRAARSTDPACSPSLFASTGGFTFAPGVAGGRGTRPCWPRPASSPRAARRAG